jgi:hypothetical protein
MKSNVLIEKLEKLPVGLQKEVEVFIDFLTFRNENQQEHIFNNGLSPQNSFQEENSLLKPTIVEESGFEKPKLKREFGGLKGQIWMSDDFDEPLEDFKDYM